MRSHPTRTALPSLCLGAVVVLAGCAPATAPMAAADRTPAAEAPAASHVPFDEATPTGALLSVASGELDQAILPPGFHYVETVDIGHSGSTSSIYVQGQPEEQGPGLYVYAVPDGVDVEYLGDDWAPQPVPELSADVDALAGDLAVTVVSDPEGEERSTVSIEAPPAGTVRLIGDGVARDDLVGMAGRLLRSVG